jgi:dTDP-glucose 4,6-dehydratase
MNSKSTILILGSNSFAGATLSRDLLKNGYKVIGVSRSPVSIPTSLMIRDCTSASNYYFEQLDINSDLDSLEALMDFEKPEVIFDFAGQGMVAESWINPEQWLHTNLVSKTKLLEILRRKNWIKKYVRASTPEVYGSHEGKILESHNYSPTTPYAITHASIDMMLMAYHTRYDFPCVIGRFANFYGPGQQLYRIVPKTILTVERGLKLPLHGGGISERAFIFSDDINSALMALATLGRPGHVYNFSPPELVSIRTLVGIIFENLSIDAASHIEVVSERPSKDHKYLMDSKKSELELNWATKVDLRDGLRQTIEWFSTYSATFSQLPLEYAHKP